MKLRSVVVFMLALLFVQQSLAVQFKDVDFSDTVLVGGKELQLNGVGVRTKFIFDIYLGALYLEAPAKKTADVHAQAGPKRVLMHFVYDEVPVEKLTAGWTEGFEENTSEEQFKKLKPRIDTFNSFFETVVKGDVVQLDYVPDKGTVVMIKGVEKGVIPGADFNNAMLDIWLGEEPADEELKEAMLGRVAEE